MTAIVVEDGTGLTNSNSYVSESELTTYATNRGITLVGVNTVLLHISMDYLEQQNFKGVKNTDEQSLQWPRYGVYIDGYYVDNDFIPDLLKESQMEFAIGIDAGNNLLAVIGRETKREKVDVIEVEYMDGARDNVYITAAETKLKKLLMGGGASTMVIRA